MQGEQERLDDKVENGDVYVSDAHDGKMNCSRVETLCFVLMCDETIILNGISQRLPQNTLCYSHHSA